MILGLLYSLLHLLLGAFSAVCIYRMAEADELPKLMCAFLALVGFLFWPIGLMCAAVDFILRRVG